MNWDDILEEWDGKVSKTVIADAIALAGNALHVNMKESRLGSLTLNRRAG